MRSSLFIVLALICCGNPAVAEPPPDPQFKLVLQALPATAVDSVAVSPDGSLVATAAGEGGVRLYDAQTGTLLRTIGEVGDRGVIFTPDGKSLTAAGFHMDKLVGVFDVQTGKRLLALSGHTEWEAYATALSPDGKLLASTGTDKQILVWELGTGKLRLQLKDQPEKIAALVFSPDSQTLASGGGDRTIRLWDCGAGELRRTLTGHADWVCALAFSPNGKTLASASCDWGFHRGHDWLRPFTLGEASEWRLWDVDSGKVQRTVKERGRLLSLAFAPSGQALACGLDREVRLYDLAATTSPKIVARHDATVTSVAFLPDGAALVSSSHDQTVRRTNLATGRLEWQAPGYFEQVNSVALSADASLLVTGSSDQRFPRQRIKAGDAAIGPGAVRLWDLRNGRMLRALGDPTEQIMAVAISADGRLLTCGGAAGSGAGVTRLYETASGGLVWNKSDHQREVLAIAFAPDAAQLATGSSDGAVQIRDARSGQILRTLPSHAGGATSLVYAADGQSLVCGDGHGGTRLFDARTGRLLHTCPNADTQPGLFTGDRLLNSIGLSADGSVLATCTSSINNEFVDDAEIWDARTGKLIRSFAAEKIHGRPMALSPDGTLLATGGKSVKLWDVRTGKLVRELYGHLKRTQSIVFSADGRLLVSGGSYGTTNAWEVETGRHLATLFAFSEDRDGKAANDWLACTREGYFTGSPGCERYLAWRVGDELLTTQLHSQLRRPDLVQASLSLAKPASP